MTAACECSAFVARAMLHAIRCDRAVACCASKRRAVPVRHQLRRLLKILESSSRMSEKNDRECGRLFLAIARRLQAEIVEDDGYGSQE